MMGFSKNKNDNPETMAMDQKAPGSVNKTSEIAEEKFIVMPKEFSAAPRAKGSAISKKSLIIGLAILGLIAIIVACFMLDLGGLFGFKSTQEPTGDSSADQVPSINTSTESVATTSASQTRVASAEARDKENNLLGSLNLNIPAAVNEQYKDSIGITVINKEDLTLPADVNTLGGVYSAYPLGVTFAEPISFLISVITLPPEKKNEDFAPAYLKGTEWQKLSEYQATPAGWTMSLDQFPNGPLTLIQLSPIASTTPTDTATSTTSMTEKIITSKDTDSDGLTDKEENLLGTDITKLDTDGDTYKDKEEIMNGYSPVAVGGAKLESAAVLKLYTNPVYGYKVYYPAKWMGDSMDQTAKQVLFISDTDEFFEILIEENAQNMPIVDWYRAQSPQLATVDLDVTVLDGATAVWSPDHLTLYVSRDSLVYILTYNTGNLAELNWLTVFEYFYKNFKFGNTNTGGENTNNNTSSTTASTTPAGN